MFCAFVLFHNAISSCMLHLGFDFYDYRSGLKLSMGRTYLRIIAGTGNVIRRLWVPVAQVVGRSGFKNVCKGSTRRSTCI